MDGKPGTYCCWRLVHCLSLRSIRKLETSPPMAKFAISHFGLKPKVTILVAWQMLFDAPPAMLDCHEYD